MDSLSLHDRSWSCSAHLNLSRSAKKLAEQAMDRANEASKKADAIQDNFAKIVESQKLQFARLEQAQADGSEKLLSKFGDVEKDVKALMKESNDRRVAHETVVKSFNMIKTAIPIIAILLAALVWYLKKESPSSSNATPQVIYVMPAASKGP